MSASFRLKSHSSGRSRRQRKFWTCLFGIFFVSSCLSARLRTVDPNEIDFEGGAVSAYTRGRSAMYTPYDLTPGGGERVFLSFLKKLQEFNGEGVDVFVRSKNVCKKTTCLKALAKKMDIVGILWDDVRVKVISYVRPGYHIWFSMGNGLFPEFKSYGLFSIYHCQFPFAALSYATSAGFERLKSYDVVYLNSKYTHFWYTRYLNTFRAQTQPTSRRGWNVPLPQIIHFPPPFSLLETYQTESLPTEEMATAGNSRTVVNIIIIGRFFEGLQCKNHRLGIKAFERLQTLLPGRDIRLTLVGNVARGHEAYFEEVRHLAMKNEHVKVIRDSDASDLKHLIRASDVVWSITGMIDGDKMKNKNAQPPQDPADAEHFGIGLLECMSAGLVPVVVDRGGTREILHGFPELLKVISVNELAESTAELLLLPQREFFSLRQRSQARASELLHSFDEGCSALFTTLGKILHPSIRDIWFIIKRRVREHERLYTLGPATVGLSSCPPVSADTHAMLYVEERVDLSLRAVISVLFDKLGPGWRLHVWHSDVNAQAVKFSLEGFACVVYHHLRDVKRSDKALTPRVAGDYQRIWKSHDFFDALGNKVEHVLTFQSDTWFPPRGQFQQSWLIEDFIGPPWCHEGNWGYLDPNKRPPEAIAMLHDSRKIPHELRVGNGGVSLRSLPAMKAVLHSHLRDSPAQENEDVFYVLSLRQDNFSVANLSDAVNFGLEVLCKDIREHVMLKRVFSSVPDLESVSFIPFALHKPFDVVKRLDVHKGSLSRIMEVLF